MEALARVGKPGPPAARYWHEGEAGWVRLAALTGTSGSRTGVFFPDAELSLMHWFSLFPTVENLLNLCCSSALPGGGTNSEFALHSLFEAKGDVMVRNHEKEASHQNSEESFPKCLYCPMRHTTSL